jgi:hypothetical protein
MAIGPVELIVPGFEHPNFHGAIIAELERLRESDTVRVIDALAVYKDADGEFEVEHLSTLTEEEAVELGSKVAALIGLGIEGEEGFDAGAAAGAEAAADGLHVFSEQEAWDVLEDIPNDSPAPAASGSPTSSSARSTSSRSGCSPPRKLASCTPPGPPAPARPPEQTDRTAQPATTPIRGERCSHPAESPAARRAGPRAASAAACDGAAPGVTAGPPATALAKVRRESDPDRHEPARTAGSLRAARASRYTKRTAEAWLRDLLDTARRGTLPGMGWVLRRERRARAGRGLVVQSRAPVELRRRAPGTPAAGSDGGVRRGRARRSPAPSAA